MHELKIKVENDTLIIRGNAEESVGCVLRGFVTLKTQDTLKAKSIYLTLTGKLKIHSKLNQQPKKGCVIFQHQWTFLSTKDTLLPNTYSYPFEMALPGHFAESVESYSFGSLSYKLKATVERPLLPNLIYRKPLWIIRQTDPHTIPRQISNGTDKLQYTITLPRLAFARGQAIPIDFALIPHRPLELRHFSCFLKEYSIYGNCSKSRIIRFIRDDHLSTWRWQKTITVPIAPSAIQTDADTAYFKIYHKLNFTVLMIDDEGEPYEIKASMPLEIVHYDEDQLPSYDCAWQSPSYTFLSPCNERDYFDCAPSYQAVCSDGLPAYEL
ncbi:hypothetical protein G6F56_006068 [Rhizopus delemar]|nr:hypothetical protein G6F56_006068 [Rhizopus delemar]